MTTSLPEDDTSLAEETLDQVLLADVGESFAIPHAFVSVSVADFGAHPDVR